jgi:hypothetical protein
MKDVIYLLYQLLTTLAKLLQPGGGRTVIAENLILKQQLIIHNRSRQRAPNLSTQERVLLGFWSLFLNPQRIVRSAIIIKPSTLLRFHNALKKRKYRLLYSPGGGRKPGPKGPSREVINAIVEMKRRNPRYGCPRIAQQINLAFGLELDKDVVRRIIGFAVHAGNVDGPTLCRMFNQATSGQDWAKYLSSDNDPLFQYHRWKANMRILEIEEIKSLPHVPMSHPFVERLIGSVRRELLDQTLFWTATDLENKLRKYQCYYNESRTHSGRNGTTPVSPGSAKVIDIKEYRWQKYCRGLYQLPMAA